MIINITYVFSRICYALSVFVGFMKLNYIQIGGQTFSIFDIELSGLAIALVLDSFIPWAGGVDEDE